MKSDYLAVAFAAGVGIFTAAGSAFAVPVVFSGYDEASDSLATSPNATSAAAAFDAAVSGATIIDFETGLPAGFNATPGSVTTDSGCPPALCGYNTTTGGDSFYLAFGGTHTFSFDTPIESFGAFFTGYQVTSQTIAYSDNSLVTLDMPEPEFTGGTAFFGFQDAGASIVSVTYNAINDIVAVDDVRLANTTTTAVPEPGTLAILGLGLAAIGLTRRRRARKDGLSSGPAI